MAAFVEASWASSASKKGGWDEVEDSNLMLELMLSSVDRNLPANTAPSPGELRTLDLLGAATPTHCNLNVDCSTSSPLITSDALDLDAPLPPGWQKCLDLQTGKVYYLQNNGSSSNQKSSNALSTHPLSPSTDGQYIMEAINMKLDIPTSSKRTRLGGDAVEVPTSNVSIFGVNLNCPPLLLKEEVMQHGGSSPRRYAISKDESRPHVLDMTTVGCANCLMFVMLSTMEPRCPNCGNCTVLDFSQPAAKRAKQT